VGNHQHTIEINGKKYDAITGDPVGGHAPKKTITVHQSVDGVVKKTASKAHKTPAKHVHSKPSRSKTLMRSAVAKPHITATSSAIDQTIETFSARKALEELRLHRAKKVPTSKLISRFGIPELSNLTVKPQHTTIPVKPAPVEHKPEHHKPATHHKAHAEAAQHTKSRFQSQIDHATAHTAKPLKKSQVHHRTTKKMRMGAATAGVAFVLLGGFIAYQNATVIAVRIAAREAGVAVTVPGYTPGGFSLRGHNTKPGEVSISYRSNSDARAFQVTEALSGWDSGTLLQNFIGTNEYQTAFSRGRTIYLYNGNNATWVDNGIWYKIEGNAGLSSQQLQKLVDSI